MAKILLVDDDKQLVQSLISFLRELGHVLDYCHSGEEALQLLRSEKYELIVLDWTMSGLSGYDVCKKFRQDGGQTPIVFLTGQSDISSLEKGLDVGADDYIAKPFDLRELNARIKSNLKRRSGHFVPKLGAQGLTLVPEQQIIYLDGQENCAVRLRLKESALLEFLLKNPNKTHNAQTLLENCWPLDAQAGPNSVRTWMGTLRQKLAELGKESLIETVLGSGYIISDKSEK